MIEIHGGLGGSSGIISIHASLFPICEYAPITCSVPGALQSPRLSRHSPYLSEPQVPPPPPNTSTTLGRTPNCRPTLRACSQYASLHHSLSHDCFSGSAQRCFFNLLNRWSWYQLREVPHFFINLLNSNWIFPYKIAVKIPYKYYVCQTIYLPWCFNIGITYAVNNIMYKFWIPKHAVLNHRPRPT